MVVSAHYLFDAIFADKAVNADGVMMGISTEIVIRLDKLGYCLSTGLPSLVTK